MPNFFQQRKKGKKRKSVQQLRQRGRQERREDETNAQVNSSSHPPFDAALVFTIALHHHHQTADVQNVHEVGDTYHHEKVAEESQNSQKQPIDDTTKDVFAEALNQHLTDAILREVESSDDTNSDTDNDIDKNPDYDDEEDDDAKDMQEEEEKEEEGGDQREREKAFRALLQLFHDYLVSKAGGRKKLDAAALTVKRVIELLERTYFSRHKPKILPTTEAEVRAWVCTLIETDHALVEKVLDELALGKGHKPNTTKTIVSDSLGPFFVWVRLFSGWSLPTPESLARMNLICKSLVASFRNAANTSKRDNAKTIEELIEDKRWPKGGMAELRAKFQEHVQDFFKTFDPEAPYIFDSVKYLDFMTLKAYGKLNPFPSYPSILQVFFYYY